MTSNLPTLLRASIEHLDVTVPIDLVQRARRGGTRRVHRRRLAALALSCAGVASLASLALALGSHERAVETVLTAPTASSPTPERSVVEVDGVQIALPEGYVAASPDGSRTSGKVPVSRQEGARVSLVRLAPEAMNAAQIKGGAPGVIDVRVTRDGTAEVVVDKPIRIVVRGEHEVTGVGVVVHHRLSPRVVIEVLGIETTQELVQQVADEAIDTGHDDGTVAGTPGPN